MDDNTTWEIAGTSADYGDTLTGFEEIAVAKHFGRPLQDLGNHDGMMALRALVMTHKARAGVKAREAYDAAMALTRAETVAYFERVAPPDDAMEDDAADPTE
jgi:hypothetical protein